MAKKGETNRQYYHDKGTLMLQCNSCLEIKPETEFNKSSHGIFGYSEKCRDCRKEEYVRKRDKILENRKEYYKNNIEKKKEYQNNYYYNNSEHIKEQHKQYRKENYDKILEGRYNNYSNNRDRIIKERKEYDIQKTEELGFGRRKFHDKCARYARVHKLKPLECMICGEQKRIVLHHPSYETFDKRKEVVFVCDSCHQNIHNGLIECPAPVDLVELKQNINGKK